MRDHLDPILEVSQGFAEPIARDTPADGVQLPDELVDALASSEMNCPMSIWERLMAPNGGSD